jgi:hypothetical protein
MNGMRWVAAAVIALVGCSGLEAREIRGTSEETRQYQKKMHKAQKQAVKNQRAANKKSKIKKSPKKKGRVQYGVKQRS